MATVLGSALCLAWQTLCYHFHIVLEHNLESVRVWLIQCLDVTAYACIAVHACMSLARSSNV